MVYRSCPQCGKRNHHNKVKCAECGVCLRAVKPGRPKIKRSDENTSVIGRPSMLKIDVQCPFDLHAHNIVLLGMWSSFHCI